MIAVAVLMLLSFMGGMLTQCALTKTPQQDANLSYIDGIPVYTDFIPEGSRARPTRSTTTSPTPRPPTMPAT